MSLKEPLIHSVGLPQVTVPMFLVPYRSSVPVRIFHCVGKCLTDELHKRNEKEETDKKHRLDVVHDVIFKSNKPIVYGLFDACAVRQGQRRKENTLTLTVLSKKFSECLALIDPAMMLSRVDTTLEYVSWILDPYGSTS